MKKQLFLCVAILAVSAEILSVRQTGGGGGGGYVPSRHASPPPPPGGQGGSSSAAQKAAQGLSAAEAIASAMQALGVTADQVAKAQPSQEAVRFITTGQ